MSTSDLSKESSEAEDAASSGTIPLVFWLVIMILMGLAIGMWSPWRDRGDRATPNDIAELVERLRDPKTRTIASTTLKDRGELAGPELLAAAKDTTFPARKIAIELLGRIRYEPAREFLFGLDDPALNGERLTAIAHLGGDDAMELMRQSLASNYYPTQCVALRSMRTWSPLPDSVRDEVLPFLEHEDDTLREYASNFFMVQRYEAAATPLIKLLQDDNGDVRQAAARALMQLENREGRDAVQRAIQTGAVVFAADR